MAVHHHKGLTTIHKFVPLLTSLVFVLVCMECCDFQFVSGDGERIIRCIEREREALLEFKQGLVDDNGSLSSWGSEDHKKECCAWDGVECSNTTGHVTILLLSECSLRGNISSALLKLHHLNFLDLTDNDFGGARIPEFIGSIKSLEYLSLSASNFSGSIPPQLGNLTNLRTLDLSLNYNIWSDNLYWLSHLSLLTYLDLSGSNISSDTNWLQHVLKLPCLQKLYLRDCMITDPVTSSTAGICVNSSSTSLISHLDLSGNKLTSSAFDWFFNISTSLVSIDLSRNLFDGPIPDAFGKLIFLGCLDLSENMLEGGIPNSFSHLPTLFLSHNNFGGHLEDLFGSLPNKGMASLEVLDLSYNQLTGSMPDQVCPGLIELHLSNNKLTGSLLASLGYLSKLERVRNWIE